MSKEFLCAKCNKSFSTLGNLKAHLKTICSSQSPKIHCEFCNHTFNVKSSLKRHYTTCKVKIERDASKEKQTNSEFILLKEKYEREKNEFTVLKEKYEKENLVLKIELKSSNQQISHLELENKRLADIVSNLTEKMPVLDQSTTNNTVNINMTLFDQLNPITEETFFQYGQEITQSVLLQGLESVLNLGMKHLKDKIVCTDRSRNTLNYKINDQLVKDKGGVRLAEQLIEQSIEPKVKLYDKTLLDVYRKKSRDPTVMKDEQSKLDSMIELRNAIIDTDHEALKTKIGSKLSKRAHTNHAMLADLNGATTQNMWEFFSQVDKTRERILFNSVEYFLVRDANKNVIRALEVDDDGVPILETEIDFSEQTRKLLPPPPAFLHSIVSSTDSDSKKKTRGRPKKVQIPKDLQNTV